MQYPVLIAHLEIKIIPNIPNFIVHERRELFLFLLTDKKFQVSFDWVLLCYVFSVEIIKSQGSPDTDFTRQN